MIVLDSDYMSLLEWPEGQASQKILARLRQYAVSDVAITIVTVEEQIHGWIKAINQNKEVKNQIDKYRRMRLTLQTYCKMNVLDFDEVAAVEYQSLRKSYRRLGANDLKIAAITRAHKATLWTRNMSDFGQIKGLDAVDITKE
jgi:tRNA(fMet)-specific endonuclease VapC